MNGSGGKMTEYVPKNSAPKSEVSFSSLCVRCLEAKETERIVIPDCLRY